MPEEARAKALAYLAAHNVMTLATAGAQGAWAAGVFYASREFELYFVSSPNSRHSQDIAAQPRIAAAIHEDYRDWRSIQGLQLSGRAEPLDGAERDAALACYRAKFTFLRNPTAALAPVLQALGKAACYRLIADELYFVDNSTGFGKRTPIVLQGHFSR